MDPGSCRVVASRGSDDVATAVVEAFSARRGRVYRSHQGVVVLRREREKPAVEFMCARTIADPPRLAERAGRQEPQPFLSPDP